MRRQHWRVPTSVAEREPTGERHRSEEPTEQGRPMCRCRGCSMPTCDVGKRVLQLDDRRDHEEAMAERGKTRRAAFSWDTCRTRLKGPEPERATSVPRLARANSGKLGRSARQRPRSADPSIDRRLRSRALRRRPGNPAVPHRSKFLFFAGSSLCFKATADTVRSGRGPAKRRGPKRRRAATRSRRRTLKGHERMQFQDVSFLRS